MAVFLLGSPFRTQPTPFQEATSPKLGIPSGPVDMSITLLRPFHFTFLSFCQGKFNTSRINQISWVLLKSELANIQAHIPRID